MSTFRNIIITPILERIGREYGGKRVAIDLRDEVAPDPGKTKYYYTLVNKSHGGIVVQWKVKNRGWHFCLKGLSVRANNDKRLYDPSSSRDLPERVTCYYW